MVLHVVHKSGCFNVQINLKWTWKYDWLVCIGRQYRNVNILWLHKYHYLFVFYFQMRSMENQVEISLCFVPNKKSYAQFTTYCTKSFNNSWRKIAESFQVLFQGLNYNSRIFRVHSFQKKPWWDAFTSVLQTLWSSQLKILSSEHLQIRCPNTWASKSKFSCWGKSHCLHHMLFERLTARWNIWNTRKEWNRIVTRVVVYSLQPMQFSQCYMSAFE